MPVHTKIDKEGIYFITFTCYDWLPLIELSHGYDAVYKFFAALIAARARSIKCGRIALM